MLHQHESKAGELQPTKQRGTLESGNSFIFSTGKVTDSIHSSTVTFLVGRSLASLLCLFFFSRDGPLWGTQLSFHFFCCANCFGMFWLKKQQNKYTSYNVLGGTRSRILHTFEYKASSLSHLPY